MSTFQSFEDIEAWQKARELTRKIYKISSRGEFAKDFGLRDQIRRASISAMSNIAEGFERNGNKEFLQFLFIAKSSVGEVKSQLYIAVDQGYIDQKTFEEIFSLANDVNKLISGLIKYLQQSDFRGSKYKRKEDQL